MVDGVFLSSQKPNDVEEYLYVYSMILRFKPREIESVKLKG